MNSSQRFLDLPDGRLAYDVRGPDGGRLVVAVPGMGDTRRTFRFLAPLLVEAGYRVVTMDVRGHGESNVDWPDYAQQSVGDDILALVDHLGGPATLIGNSSGAGAVAFAAAAAPERVTSLVLISTFASPPRLNPFLRAAQGLVLRSPLLWSFYFRSLFATVRPDDHDTYVRDLRRMLGGRMAAVRGLVAPGESWTGVAGDIRCPVLVIQGSKDPDFPDPAAEARAARSLLTGADPVVIRILDGAGHYPQVEYPDETLAAIREFEARQHA